MADFKISGSHVEQLTDSGTNNKTVNNSGRDNNVVSGNSGPVALGGSAATAGEGNKVNVGGAGKSIPEKIWTWIVSLFGGKAGE